MYQRGVCMSFINWLNFDFPSYSLHLGRGKKFLETKVVLEIHITYNEVHYTIKLISFFDLLLGNIF